MKSPVILLLACPQSLSPILACQAPGDLPRPGIEPGSLALQADSLPDEMPEKQPPAPMILLITKSLSTQFPWYFTLQ